MAEKKPQAGEWWRTRGGDRRYVAAVLQESVSPLWRVISVDENGNTESHLIDGSALRDCEHRNDLVEHLPWCTSFDDPDPHVSLAGTKIGTVKVSAIEPVSETWLKWYVPKPDVAMSGEGKLIAYAVLHPDKTGETVHLDGTSFTWTGGTFEHWREVSKAEALARLQPPVQICPDCGEPLTPGHADVCPMAWVVQDRVPYRDGVDQWKLEWGKSWVSHSQPHLLKMHGEGEIGYRYEVRTRRKDLPQLSVETCAACDQPAEPGTAGCREHNEYAADIASPHIHPLGPHSSEPDTVPVRLFADTATDQVYMVRPGGAINEDDDEVLIVGKEFRVRKAVQG